MQVKIMEVACVSNPTTGEEGGWGSQISSLVESVGDLQVQ